MPIQIEINDAHIQPLIDFYIKRLRTLKDEIMEREREMKEISQVIQKLKKREVISDTDAEITVSSIPYSDKWTWVKKIEFAIEYQNKPLTTKEIVDTLTEFEPSFLFDRKRVVASISSTLSSKSGPNKEFVRVERDSGEFAYHLKPDESTPGVVQTVDVYDDLPF